MRIEPLLVRRVRTHRATASVPAADASRCCQRTTHVCIALLFARATHVCATRRSRIEHACIAPLPAYRACMRRAAARVPPAHTSHSYRAALLYAHTPRALSCYSHVLLFASHRSHTHGVCTTETHCSYGMISRVYSLAPSVRSPAAKLVRLRHIPVNARGQEGSTALLTPAVKLTYRASS